MFHVKWFPIYILHAVNICNQYRKRFIFISTITNHFKGLHPFMKMNIKRALSPLFKAFCILGEMNESGLTIMDLLFFSR